MSASPEQSIGMNPNPGANLKKAPEKENELRPVDTPESPNEKFLTWAEGVIESELPSDDPIVRQLQVKSVVASLRKNLAEFFDKLSGDARRGQLKHFEVLLDRGQGVVNASQAKAFLKEVLQKAAE